MSFACFTCWVNSEILVLPTNTNFHLSVTKQIGKFMSECLVLGAVNGKDVMLLNPENQVENGSIVS